MWMINLERSKDRLEFQHKQFKEHGLEFTRYDAVNGREDLSKHLEGLKLSHQWREMSNGQRGCALTHVSILKKMVSENIPAVFVLEDDVVLCENFSHEFEKFFHDDDLKYDIVYVGNQHDKIKTNELKINRPTFCTHAIIYTLEGAKNILKHIQEVGLYVYDIVLIQADIKNKLKTISYIKKPSDEQIEKYKLHVVRSVGLCYQTQLFESVIHN
jgi:GR25 family glycosyltransferase involved in LPS biosynthesis